jgi:hypothetical protein
LINPEKLQNKMTTGEITPLENGKNMIVFMMLWLLMSICTRITNPPKVAIAFDALA